METILAKHVFTVYDKDGYKICKYQNIETYEQFTACGNNLLEYQRVIIKLEGDWGENKHGRCFYAKNCVINLEETRESIILYLSCGMFPYIGSAVATKIYEKFGNDTIKVLDEDIYALSMIKGLTPKRIEKIATVYKSERNKKELINLLLPFGIPHNVTMRVDYAYDDMYYPEDICEKIKVEPFKLIDVKGITIKTIANIAKTLGANTKTYSCFRAYALSIISEAEVAGNTVIRSDLMQSMIYEKVKEYGFTPKEITEHLKAMIKKEELILITKEDGCKYVGLARTCKREYESAKLLTAMKKNRNGILNKDAVKRELDRLCKEKNITLDEVQENAVIMALTEKVSIITGGGGTGKTTITELISTIMENIGSQFVTLLAPTARASRVLAEACDKPASTIHSGLQIRIDNEDGYESEEDVCLENSFVICDEGSMVDAYVFWQLMRHMSPTCCFTFIGDIDQLPSVGAGAVLRDVIESGAFPVTKLEKIYRQEEGSKININAQKIKKGITDIDDGIDYHFIECNEDNIEALMKEKTLEMISKYGKDNIMCLCPYKSKLNASVSRMNAILQEELNPQTGNIPVLGRGNFEFRVGDMVMQTQKNHMECSNGDIGVITDIVYTKEDKSITVSFPITQTTYTYEDEDIDELVLAYASTIHKAQGSQAEAVVTCLLDYHSFMLKRNFLYTAVSRAKKELWVYGNKSAFNKAILTEDTYRRETSLKHFITMFSGRKEEKEEYEQMRLNL